MAGMYPGGATPFDARRPGGSKTPEFPDVPFEVAVGAKSPYAYLDPYARIPGITEGPTDYPNVRGDTPEAFLLPYQYNPSIQTGNIAVKSLLEQLGGTEESPYAPPAAGRLGETLAALKGMSSTGKKMTMGDRTSGFLGADYDSLGLGKYNQMLLGEPERQSPLLEALMGQYKVGGATVAQHLGATAKRQKIYDSYRSARKELKKKVLGQTPLIGGILSGFL